MLALEHMKEWGVGTPTTCIYQTVHDASTEEIQNCAVLLLTGIIHLLQNPQLLDPSLLVSLSLPLHIHATVRKR